MAVAIILIAVLACFVTGIAFIVFMPILHKLAYEDPVWSNPNTDPKALSDRDIIYNATLALPIFMLGAIILWAFLAVSRQDQQDY